MKTRRVGSASSKRCNDGPAEDKVTPRKRRRRETTEAVVVTPSKLPLAERERGRGRRRGRDRDTVRGRGGGRGRGRGFGSASGGALDDNGAAILDVLDSAAAADVAAAKGASAAAAAASARRRAFPSDTGLTYMEATTAASKKTSRATLADAGLPSSAAMAGAMAALDADPRTARVQEEQRRAVARVTRPDKIAEVEFYLAAGHSLLFYGLGSKFEALEALAQKIADESVGMRREVLAVDGFSPHLTVRTLVSQVAQVVLPEGAQFRKRHVLDYVHAISEAFARVVDEVVSGGDSAVRKGSRKGMGKGMGRGKGMGKEKEKTRKCVSVDEGVAATVSSLVLVIHNIDGTSLRAPETQSVLSALAAIPRLSLIASVDHVNAPLMWDGVMYNRFRWRWVALSTYARYSREMTFTTEPLLSGGDESRVESAIALLNSLSPNARKLFQLLAKMQVGTDKMGGDSSGAGGGDSGGAGGKGKKGKAKGKTKGGGGDDSDSSSDGDGVGNGKSYGKHQNGDSAASAGRVPPRRTTFVELSNRSRDEYIATDPVAVKSFLTELETHDLLERRRGADAAEQLWIPLSVEQLTTVMLSVPSLG